MQFYFIEYLDIINEAEQIPIFQKMYKLFEIKGLIMKRASLDSKDSAKLAFQCSPTPNA